MTHFEPVEYVIESELQKTRIFNDADDLEKT
jgi:hypothetical protein